jgi:AhpD family alkylhydroperoxidase
MSTEPRIAPGDRSDVGPVNWAFAAISGRVTKSEPPKLFLTMGRHRGLFRGWLRFAGKLMPGGKLPRRESELVILRVSHLRGCAYEREHHIKLGRRAGLTPEEIERTAADLETGSWGGRDRALLDAVDELIRDRDLGDATWAALRTHLDERRAIELVLLTGHYDMLATFINTLRIQPDRRRQRRG